MADTTDIYGTSTAATTSTVPGPVLAVIWIFYIAIIAFALVTMWRVFTKAGKPGWASLIPIYNSYILMEVIGRPWWWLLLLLIPIVNIVVSVMVAVDLAKSFGKSPVFGVVALFIFSIVGYAILAFGSATYIGPSASDGTTPPGTDPMPPMPTVPPAPMPPATPTV